MNYRHSFHAGNFADVFKHTVLISLIQAIARKETPFCFLDTHAGSGYCDLLAGDAQKTKEFESGICKILQQFDAPELIKTYLHCVEAANTAFNTTPSPLRYYPGSPLIAKHFLRPQDRMILSELDPKAHQVLKKHFARDKQVSVQLIDGYQALKAFLPPKERRGLILIDPPYERANELNELVTTLPPLVSRFATGVYAIWYPIKDKITIEKFYAKLKDAIKHPMLAIELSIYPENNPQYLNGSGMLIINPPWQLSEQVNAYLPWLWRQLSVKNQGQYRIVEIGRV